MLTTDALTRLHDHQSRILVQIDGAVAMLGMDPDTARLPLARLRWTMVRMLRAYQLFKHGEIFEPVAAHGDADQRARARQMREACIAAGERFAAHVARWSCRDVVSAWSEYQPALRSAAADLRSHIAQERRQIERLLAGSVRTRRPTTQAPTAAATAPTAATAVAATASPGRSPPAARADSRAP
jgi:hypothetical protein